MNILQMRFPQNLTIQKKSDLVKLSKTIELKKSNREIKAKNTEKRVIDFQTLIRNRKNNKEWEPTSPISSEHLPQRKTLESYYKKQMNDYYKDSVIENSYEHQLQKDKDYFADPQIYIDKVVPYQQQFNRTSKFSTKANILQKVTIKEKAQQSKELLPPHVPQLIPKPPSFKSYMKSKSSRRLLQDESVLTQTVLTLPQNRRQLIFNPTETFEHSPKSTFQKTQSSFHRNLILNDQQNTNFQNNILQKILTLKSKPNTEIQPKPIDSVYFEDLSYRITNKASKQETLQNLALIDKHQSMPKIQQVADKDDYTYMKVRKLPQKWNDNYYQHQHYKESKQNIMATTLNIKRTDNIVKVQPRLPKYNELIRIGLLDEYLSESIIQQKTNALQEIVESPLLFYGEAIKKGFNSIQKKQLINQRQGFDDSLEENQLYDNEDYFHYYVQDQKHQ